MAFTPQELIFPIDDDMEELGHITPFKKEEKNNSIGLPKPEANTSHAKLNHKFGKFRKDKSPTFFNLDTETTKKQNETLKKEMSFNINETEEVPDFDDDGLMFQLDEDIKWVSKKKCQQKIAYVPTENMDDVENYSTSSEQSMSMNSLAETPSGNKATLELVNTTQKKQHFGLFKTAPKDVILGSSPFELWERKDCSY